MSTRSSAVVLVLLLSAVHSSSAQLRTEGDPSSAADASQAARVVSLKIGIHGDAAEPVPATVRATAVTLSADGEEQNLQFETSVEFPGTLPLSFPTDGTWKVELEADGYWCQDLVVGPRPESQVEMTVYPLVPLNGKVAVEEEISLPSDLALRFQAVPPSKAKGPFRQVEGTARCPIDDEGLWRCQAPGGNFDVRLRADGFVSHYFWDRNLAQVQEREFGTLTLRKGASIVATVQTEDESPVTEDCTATLVPQMMPAEDPAAETRARNLRNSIPVGERGFVHFKGLTPGSYLMMVEQGGFATLTLEPIVVREGQETDLEDPLVLQRPLTLKVSLVPELDLNANPWQVDLRSTGFLHRRIASGLADRTGHWRMTGLEPGPYSLTVTDSRRSRMAHEEFFLEAGRTDLEIELLTVQVTGRVSLGEEPLAARLSFGGLGPVAIRVETDPSGEYEAWLPTAGPWDVDVQAREPRVFRRLREVPVEVDRGTRIARVDIELPETLIEGNIYEENGAPVKGATVLITRVPATESPSHDKSDEEGAFSIRGYPPGDYRLQATQFGKQGLRTSETIEIEISEAHPTATARLVLRDLVSLRGRVASRSGGVPGATVKVRPLAAGARLPGLLFPTIVTDATGAFEVRVPRTATEVDVTAFPAGFLLARLRLPADPSTELRIPAHQDGGGTLVIEREQTATRTGTSSSFVVYEGLLDLDLGTLETWASMNDAPRQDSALIVPRVPAGNYSYCRRERPADDADPIQLCESGFLSPLGELRLDSPTGNSE